MLAYFCNDCQLWGKLYISWCYEKHLTCVYSKIAHTHIVSCNLMAFRIATLQAALFCIGTRIGAVGWGTALQAGRSRVRFPMVSLELFIYIILPAALWLRGRLSF